MIKAAEKIGITTASEVFADRTYQDDGSLTPRSKSNAIITDEKESINQVLLMVQKQQVIAVNEQTVNLKAETLCLHSDGKHAVAFAQLINEKLKAKGILIKAP